MGKFVLMGARLFAGGADLTTRNNKIEQASEVEAKDVTAFNPDSPTEVWREVIAGLASTTATAGGQWEAGDPGKVDDNAWTTLGAVGAWTACPAGAAVGGVAWLTSMLAGSYKLGDQVGEVAPWEASWSGSSPLCRGQVMHPPGTARTETGDGTAAQLGALTDAHALYVTLHVLSVAGTDTPSLTVVVESDEASDMATATVRHTFAAATAVGGLTAKIPGPVTDDWWRVGWTITGTGPSFLFVVAAGIGPA